MYLPRLLIILMLIVSPLWSMAAEGIYRNWEDALANKSDVRIIRMAYRSMDSIPDILDKFPNLEELDLNNNAIRTLPPSFGRCTKLVKLNLFRNKILEIPESI